MNNQDIVQRDILPIPDRPHTGLITYDAKDPDTSFPPIEQFYGFIRGASKPPSR